MDKTIRVGIAGMGFGAQVHLPALQRLDGVSVTALADGGSGRAAKIAATLSAPVSTYRDGVTMARASDVDLVVVATPPATQTAIVFAALESGKAVYCEKPFGVSLDEAEAMATAAIAARRPNAVGFQFRQDPGIRYLVEEIRSDRVGAVHRIDVAWLTSGGRAIGRNWSWRHDAKTSGGVLPEYGSHVLDYLTLLAHPQGSSKPQPITAVTMHAHTAVTRRPEGSSDRAVTGCDRIEMLVEIGDVVAHVSISNVEPVALGHRITVHHDQGRLVLLHRPPFGNADLRILAETAAGESALPINIISPEGGDSRIAATSALLTGIVSQLRDNQPVPGLPSFQDGLAARRAMAMAEASVA